MGMLDSNVQAYLKRYGISLSDVLIKYDIDNWQEGGDWLWQTVSPNDREEVANCISDTTLVLIVIGIGNGELVRVLREQIAEKTRLIIWEPDWKTFFCACQRDLSDIILNDTIDLIIGDDSEAESRLEKIFRKRLDYSNLYHCAILSMPGFQEKYQKYSEMVNEAFNKATFDLRVDVGTREHFAQHNCRNELYAMSIMHNNSLIDHLWGAIPTREIPVIIVASGPSLKKNVMLLKGLENKALILSAAHSATVLHEYGAPMHFAAMLDGLGGAHFMDYDTENRERMLMGATTIRFLQEKYNGQSIYFSFDQKLFPLSEIEGSYYGYKMGGSITTALLGMVRAAGFKNVILIGQDLAYDDAGFSHASGEREERNKDVWFDGIYGGKVRGRNDWALFLNSFETEIREHPELTVIDATEGGALIHGSLVMTFQEAIDRYCKVEYPVQEWIDSIPKNGEKCRWEIEKLIKNHYARICETGQRLSEITQIGRYLSEQCEMHSLGEERNRPYCERYDQLYKKIIDDDSDELTMMYGDDVVQQYVVKAMALEGDDIVDRRMRLELELFMGLLDRNNELEKYIKELFPDCSNGA